MNLTQLYVIIADDVFVLMTLSRISIVLSLWVQNRILFLVLKHLMYSFIFRRDRYFDSQTRWRFLLISLYWLEIAVCNVIDVKSLLETSNRANTLSTIHLISLLFFDRLNFAIDLLELSLHFYMSLHEVIDFMSFIQNVIHVLLFLLRNSLRTENSVQFYDLLIKSASSFVIRSWS